RTSKWGREPDPMAVARSQAVSRHLQTLFNQGAIGALTDGELLERFMAHRGEEVAEAAFAALVERHAPMVLDVCRDVLGNVHDAEDASQATFLVLARKARSIRSGAALGSWLHGVALRVASKARVAAARRRVHERRGGEMAARSVGDRNPFRTWMDLHEELDRLPERLRSPIVLCYLEGLTHGQAAHRLGWPVGTVESRLARARERLRRRLAGRGEMAMTLSSAASFPVRGSAAVPSGWIEATARAATRYAAGEAATAVASAQVASLTRGMLWARAVHQFL